MSLAKFLKKMSTSEAGKAVQRGAAKVVTKGAEAAAHGAVAKDAVVSVAKKNPGKLAAGAAAAGFAAGASGDDMEDDKKKKTKKRPAYLD